MSKRTLRKGVALGTALSFGILGLTSMPASADSTGRVTFTPDGGETFNTVLGETFYATTGIDGDLDFNDQFLTYKIENPNRDNIQFEMYNNDSGWEEYDNFNVYVMKNGELVDAATVNGDLPGDVDYDNTDYFNAATLYVEAYDSYADGENDLAIYADETGHDVAIGVTSWLDINEDGILDADEQQFATTKETINFFDPAGITATVKLDPTDIYVNEGDSNIDFEIAFNKALNVYQLNDSGADADWAVALFKNGQALESEDPEVDYDAADFALDVDLEEAYGYDNNTGILYGSFDTVDNEILPANYTARVAYIGASDVEDYAWAGPRSTAIAASEGTNSDIEYLEVTAAAKNALADDEDFEVRAGVKSIEYTAQAYDSSDEKVEASNIRVRVIVDYDEVVDGSKLTVSGSSDVLTSTSGEIVVFGRTDAAGQFKFTVTTAAALADEMYDIVIGHLPDGSGSWDEESTIDVDYVDTEVDLSSFAFANDVLAGKTATAVLTVDDQFGEPISSVDGAALKVYLYDTADSTKLAKTENVTAGKATFSITNYVEVGDVASLRANLFTGSDKTDAIDTDYAELYNPAATGAVLTDSKIENEVITYDDFILGDPEDDASGETVAPSNDDRFFLEGTVEDVNGAGLPAAVVTISASGLQFEDLGDSVVNYTKDSVTVVADELGKYSVAAWAHKVGDITITTTSGSKSAKTALSTVFNTVTADDVLVSWNAPKHPAISKLYVVSAKVSDKWGNVIEGADVSFSTDGVLQVNGDDAKDKTTNAAGKTTVYVGGASKLSGFGSVTATVESVVITQDDGPDSDLDASELSAGDATSITQEVLVGVSASAVASVKKGQLNVSAWNTKGKSLQVYVGGKLKATRTTVAGVDKVYVKGLSAGSKLVTIKVAGSTYFSEYVTVK